MSSSTKVVCLRRKGGEIVQGCDIYIGRAWKLGGWDLKRSKWANPFTIKKAGSVQKSLELYEEYVRNNPELINSLEELRGKVLGCWCKKKGNELCHGDTLIRLLEEGREGAGR